MRYRLCFPGLFFAAYSACVSFRPERPIVSVLVLRTSLSKGFCLMRQLPSCMFGCETISYALLSVTLVLPFLNDS